eukprot:6210265-Pleurochrysis_carterae.AAC.1
MATPSSAAADEMFHPPTIPLINSSATNAGWSRGRTGGRATASAPRVAVEGGSASGPPTRPSAMLQSALSALCGIETRSEGWAPAASGRPAQSCREGRLASLD